jgi:hypothetical protein
MMGWFKKQAIFGSLNQLAAGRQDSIDKLRLAVSSGADVNAWGMGHGLTPLMRTAQLASRLPEGSGMMLAVIILCDAGADPLKKDKRQQMNAIEYAKSLGLFGMADRFEAQARSREIMAPLREAGFRV